jgi:hypothetical protein
MAITQYSTCTMTSADTSKDVAVVKDMDDNVAIGTRPRRLLPPPALVTNPTLQDVLLPMEKYTTWTGNSNFKTLLQKYQNQLDTSETSKKQQMSIVLEIIQEIEKKKAHSGVDSNATMNDDDDNDGSGGRFLMAVPLPNFARQPKFSTDLVNKCNECGIDHATLLSKTIWEVMYETDIIATLTNLLLLPSERNTETAFHADDAIQKDQIGKEYQQNQTVKTNSVGSDSNKSSDINNKNGKSQQRPKESYISTSSLAILQGLYYVPYQPVTTTTAATTATRKKRPHEYDSNDSADESVPSRSYLDTPACDFRLRTAKKRKVVHRKPEDVKLPVQPGKPKPRAPPTPKTSAIAPIKSHITVPPKENPPIISVAEKDGTPSEPVPSESPTTTTTNTVATIVEKKPVVDTGIQFKPKSLKSIQAILDQEGTDANLPKGVTVRPSGKWVRINCFRRRNCDQPNILLNFNYHLFWFLTPLCYSNSLH